MNEHGLTTEQTGAVPGHENGARAATEPHHPAEARESSHLPETRTPLDAPVDVPGLTETPLPAPTPLMPLVDPIVPDPPAAMPAPAVPDAPAAMPAPVFIPDTPPPRTIEPLPAAPMAPVAVPAGAGSADAVKMMEERLRRLEDVLVQMNERQLAAPVAPVATRVEEKPQEGIRDKASRLAGAGKAILPIAAGLLRSPDPTSPTAMAGALLNRPAGKPPWLIVEVYHELRTIVRMYLDRAHYQVRPVGWAVPLLTLFVILTDRWFLENSPFFIGAFFKSAWFITSPLVIVIDLVMAFVMYKALLREAARYLATINPPQPPVNS